jgi:hypothetical protein
MESVFSISSDGADEFALAVKGRLMKKVKSKTVHTVFRSIAFVSLNLISLIGFALFSDRQQGLNRTQKRRNSQHFFIIFTVCYNILRHLSAFECG